MFVREVLLVVGDAPLGMDRASSADDARKPIGRVRHEREQDSRVDGEVVYSLLCLFDKSVTEDLPCQILSNTAHLGIRHVSNMSCLGKEHRYYVTQAVYIACITSKSKGYRRE